MNTDYLRTIDFVNGVRSEDIQHNFTQLDLSIDRERLRTGGWGLVEGFKLTALDNFQVKIGPGVFINKDGQELNINETTIGLAAPEIYQITETCEVNDQGDFVLGFTPYIDAKKGWLTNSYYAANYPMNAAFLIVSTDDSSVKIKAMHINYKTITIDASRFANKKVTVTYYYSNNRIDCLLLNKDGSYSVRQGITSTSPSVVDYGDYENSYSIGYGEITMGDSALLTMSETPRSYRRVYVNEDNILYLNGKPYKESKFIYFIEPENPIENDIWYDLATNCLMIYIQTNGIWGWKAVNESLSVAKRERKMWTIDDFPADDQTFLFSDDEVNLRFVPNNKELEIVIDNAPLMSDQYTEIVMDNTSGKDYLNVGVGFKLANPLDRSTCVECSILHSVQLQPIRSTFQRAAVFVNENYTLQETANTSQVFKTDDPYLVNDGQLEIFVNGAKFTKGLDWIEMLDATTEATSGDMNKVSNYYKVKKELIVGQTVAYRIERHVWSYDQLNALVDGIEGKADSALEKCDDLQTQITNLKTNTAQNILALTNTINTVSIKANQVDSCMKKTDTVGLANIDQNIKKLLPASIINTLSIANAIIEVDNAQITDFISVSYMDGSTTKILVKDTDYTMANIDGSSNLQIYLNSSLVSTSNSVYVYGIHFGLT